ncbi:MULTISPECIES: acyl-CoA dehydrogenase family protein [unclassified Mycobacterium]|uniref:acyl-CoA dehydrogenase family protein n=1 Tax=unclassified Mycobacterium TaxID=2642494 RepID=UPI000491F339|nr:MULTISPECIES: acyl-CoA dehydrogenase family protein [unclassified Mycobacterium]SEA62297.1 hypothetical protein SAMN04488580_103476 [Mycobacterium sp. 283mftsu]
MDLTLSPAEDEFRTEFRQFLASHPVGPEPVGEDNVFAWQLEWQRTLDKDGWAAPHWPTAYGGRDATPTQIALYYEELGRARRPMVANVIGVLLAGPTIMAWGTPEQKARLLPEILSGNEIWCQCFSEPGAGSDLASLRTRAVRDGDEWVITGQKVWTSHAQYAKWGLLVARTDPTAAKHKGLSYFLLDMQQPGVDVRPLRQITGESEFNEVFLNEARVPSSAMLGNVGDGWKVAMTTLMNERGGLGLYNQAGLRNLLDDLVAETCGLGLLDDQAVAVRIGELESRVELIRLLAYQGLATTEQNGQPGPEGSMVKLLWSTTNQLVTQTAADLLGADALRNGSRWSRELLRARANTIEGGTTEILHNIIAERVLGLPKAV